MVIIECRNAQRICYRAFLERKKIFSCSRERLCKLFARFFLKLFALTFCRRWYIKSILFMICDNCSDTFFNEHYKNVFYTLETQPRVTHMFSIICRSFFEVLHFIQSVDCSKKSLTFSVYFYQSSSILWTQKADE